MSGTSRKLKGELPFENKLKLITPKVPQLAIRRISQVLVYEMNSVCVAWGVCNAIKPLIDRVVFLTE